MLSEERFRIILDEIDKKESVTVSELVELLKTSESTIRRDLNTLNNMGKLNKVHGGATKVDFSYLNEEDNSQKNNINIEEKHKIACYAASLINENDFVYIDAGTSTEIMVEYITESKATYVTNGISHAKLLAKRGFDVIIVSGRLKSSTEAIVGPEAIRSLTKYNFTKGFFGTNGISELTGFTTPDINESIVKEEAIGRCSKAYVLSDPSKFNKSSYITFADLDNAIIITTKLKDDKFKKIAEVIEV